MRSNSQLFYLKLRYYLIPYKFLTILIPPPLTFSLSYYNWKVLADDL